jgi:hypothetical protein
MCLACSYRQTMTLFLGIDSLAGRLSRGLALGVAMLVVVFLSV